ncbi:hypothetical protein [Rosistilla oblonga]|uniref:Uncharacterized protein n=1 Tax=Rosistilla oblonga TaxID=2527990 RepID=A0A518IT07_9BACT|nr:hypothetical protein [Rosistilla oblonga]QDV56234.1 hypothetical protein Mal33_22160 [Rosistilla oblonga]
MKRLFNLGAVVGTPASLAFLEKHNITPIQLLQRHVTGDFGDLCEEDCQLNHEAIKNGERILSAFEIGGDKLYLITEADRSSTCCLMANEY